MLFLDVDEHRVDGHLAISLENRLHLERLRRVNTTGRTDTILIIVVFTIIGSAAPLVALPVAARAVHCMKGRLQRLQVAL